MCLERSAYCTESQIVKGVYLSQKEKKVIEQVTETQQQHGTLMFLVCSFCHSIALSSQNFGCS
jgi:cytochrome c2